MRKIRGWQFYSVIGIGVFTQNSQPDACYPIVGFRLVRGAV